MTTLTPKTRALILTATLTLVAAAAHAQTVIYVDDDASPSGDGATWATAYDSLSTALATAQPGDQIWTAAGTYVGNFTLTLGVELYGGFDGTETELTQRDWAANPTILDGNASGSVVTAPPGATETTRIDGFTITNGFGIHVETSSLIITNNTITRNILIGGIRLDSSSATISNNIIMTNAGSGISLESSSATIANNTILGNHTDSFGGGLYVSSSSATIVNNTIKGNTAAFGGGMAVYSSSLVIANNNIIGNTADSGGGGVKLSNSSPAMTNNTIASNRATTGGGIYLYPSSSPSNPTITNTIVAYNSSGIHGSGGDPTLRFNCVYGNKLYDYAYLTDPTGTDGNISEDPQLVDLTYGIAHIQPDSPCIDAGNNADAWGDWDIDGQPRILPPGGTVDIGADESDGTQWPKGPPVIVRVSPLGDDTNDGSSWPLAKRTVQAGIDAAATLGGEVWVRAGRYEERINLHPFAYVYGGFAGIEVLREERNWTTNISILDGQAKHSVVTARGGYGVVTAIDGFTITNGHYTVGGGLYLEYAAPTIANNAITGNDASRTGGGLYLYRSDPIIANNSITGNFTDQDGGGLYLDESDPTMANNMISGNNALAGGGMYLYQSNPTIANNTVISNGADGTGGGLRLYDSAPTIANTIVAFNSSGIYRSSGGTPTLRHNCVYGNTEYDYSGLTDPTGIDGNISADPLLADLRYGNVHIQPDSHCADAGSNADALTEFDVDGQPRIQPMFGTVDIGADESDGTVWAAGPSTIVRVSPAGDDSNDGSSWPLAKRTVQAGIDAAARLGGDAWVQAGVYEERITLLLYAHLFGGFAGHETVREQRDWSANTTTLDGQQQGPVVTARGGYKADSTIDGFTITNGSSSFGGGLYLQRSFLTVTNNTITGNTAYAGGGLYVVSDSSPTIANNAITGNTANAGGGFYLVSNSSPTIANNAIMGNTSAYTGGGLYLINSSPTIANNSITDNDADVGGGLYLTGSSPTIANTIIAFNSSGIRRYSGAPALWHNCVHANTWYDYDGLTDPTGIDGNISADPMFARLPDPGPDDEWGTPDDDLGDLQLLAASPCIDAADNAAVPADTIDLDDDADTTEPLPIDLAGFRRFVDDPNAPDTGAGTPPIVDMGAYERLPGDCGGEGGMARDGRVDLADYAGFVLCVVAADVQPPELCQCFDLDASGLVDLPDFAVFQVTFTKD